MRVKSAQRYELKYVLHRDRYAPVLEDLAEYMEPDVHGDDHGCYTVTSLYYDTAGYNAYWDKIEGLRFRRKVRLRVYGDQIVTPATTCFLEIKQRLNKTIQKKRVLLPYSSAVPFHDLDRNLAAASEADQAVMQEVCYLYRTLQLQPACIVRYKRRALNGNQYNPDLRVTFDTNLRCRIHDLTLLSQSQTENRYFLPPQWCIMEIKVNRSVPYWLAYILYKHGCAQRRLSKYCAALEQCQAILSRQRIVC